MLDSLRSRRDADGGFSLIEVLVAFLIFAFIAASMAVTLVTISRATREAHVKQVASNLAASKVDELLEVRDTVSLDQIPTTSTTIEGTTYTVATSVGWVTSTGATEACGTGGGNLLFKRANVSVTWTTMGSASPVVMSTILAPSSRIVDPSTGTILVKVYGVDGTARSGVTVTAVGVASGGSTPVISTTIPATDSQGCSLVLSAPPGTYNVSVSRAGYVDINQSATSTVQRTVTAGASVNALFEYDQAATVTLALAPNVSGAAPLVSSTMGMGYFSGSNSYPLSVASSPVSLYPYSAGYTAVAGSPATCAAHDPANWPETTTLAAGQRGPIFSTTPGGASTANVPLGVVTVTPAQSGRLEAVQQNSGTPGCATPPTYAFGNVTAGVPVRIALPYGRYALSTVSTLNIRTAVSSVGVVASSIPIVGGVLGTSLPGGSTAVGNQVTLDPRVAK